MEINKYLMNLSNTDIALVLNSNYNKKIQISKGKIKDYLYSVSNASRVSKVLKMLGLEETVLSKANSELTYFEEALVVIAWQLLQNNYLIIYYLDTLLNFKENS